MEPHSLFQFAPFYKQVAPMGLEQTTDETAKGKPNKTASAHEMKIDVIGFHIFQCFIKRLQRPGVFSCTSYKQSPGK